MEAFVGESKDLCYATGGPVTARGQSAGGALIAGQKQGCPVPRHS
jgi:hypothetical protein